jgi:hypothetical protein
VVAGKFLAIRSLLCTTLDEFPGIATKNFMLGVFALGTKPTNFSDFNEPQLSFLWSLRNQSLIPSLSYGYSAGAHYNGNGFPGTLTLGGYDTSRFKLNNLIFPFIPNESQSLVTGIQTIQADKTFSGVVSLLPKGVLLLIDSTVPEIWLPLEACQMFETAFGEWRFLSNLFQFMRIHPSPRL